MSRRRPTLEALRREARPRLRWLDVETTRAERGAVSVLLVVRRPGHDPVRAVVATYDAPAHAAEHAAVLAAALAWDWRTA